MKIEVQEAKLEGVDICKVISIHNGATNGEVITSIFPNIKVKVDPQSPCITETSLDGFTSFNTDWWKALYKGDQL